MKYPDKKLKEIDYRGIDDFEEVHSIQVKLYDMFEDYTPAEIEEIEKSMRMLGKRDFFKALSFFENRKYSWNVSKLNDTPRLGTPLRYYLLSLEKDSIESVLKWVAVDYFHKKFKRTTLWRILKQIAKESSIEYKEVRSLFKTELFKLNEEKSKKEQEHREMIKKEVYFEVKSEILKEMIDDTLNRVNE